MTDHVLTDDERRKMRQQEAKAKRPKDIEAARQQALAAVGDLDVLVSDYMHFKDERQRWAAVLWTAHTYTYNAVDDDGYYLHSVVPYLWVKSAGRESGKTTLAELLSMTANNGQTSDSMTASALFRQLNNEDEVTFFFDEADNTIPSATSSDGDDSRRDLLAFLNSGFKRDKYILRTNKKTMDVEKFPTFCPKAIIGIRVRVADTLSSRCIHVMLERATTGEVKTRWRERHVKPRADAIRQRLAAVLPGLPQESHTTPRPASTSSRTVTSTSGRCC